MDAPAAQGRAASVLPALPSPTPPPPPPEDVPDEEETTSPNRLSRLKLMQRPSPVGPAVDRFGGPGGRLRASMMGARSAIALKNSQRGPMSAPVGSQEDAEFARFLSDPSSRGMPEAALTQPAGRFPKMPLGLSHEPEPQEDSAYASSMASASPDPQRAFDAMLEERTKVLNELFEQQLKKQYETMKAEAAKLAKRHQRDVNQLDERFKQKMGGADPAQPPLPRARYALGAGPGGGGVPCPLHGV